MEISGDLFMIRKGFLPTAKKRYPASMWIYWFPALALTIFVYSTLSVVPDWRESLVSIYGPSMITWGIAIPLGFFFLPWQFSLIHGKDPKNYTVSCGWR